MLVFSVLVITKVMTTRRGEQMLNINGQNYYYHEHRGLKVVWRCSHKRKGCKSRAITVENIVVKLTIHNH